jgi:hypothetical protein
MTPIVAPGRFHSGPRAGISFIRMVERGIIARNPCHSGPRAGISSKKGGEIPGQARNDSQRSASQVVMPDSDPASLPSRFLVAWWPWGNPNLTSPVNGGGEIPGQARNDNL